MAGEVAAAGLDNWLQHLGHEPADAALESRHPLVGEVGMKDPSKETVLGPVDLERRTSLAELRCSGVVEAVSGNGEGNDVVVSAHGPKAAGG